MDWFICNECGRVFSGDDSGTEEFLHTEVRPHFVERYVVCPDCGSASYDDAVECCRCGEPRREEDLLGGYYCADCMADLRDAYHEREYVSENLDDYADWIHDRRQRNHADKR